MPKFFVNREQINNDNIFIPDHGHITRVLRMDKGDRLLLSDGCGVDYFCEIAQISKDCVLCKILDQFPCPNEPQINITLFQCLPKSSKMDLIIEKCVELGIYEIVPVISEHTIKNDTSPHKLQRYRKIAEAAAKQSMRGIIPSIAPPIHIDQAMERLLTFPLALMPYEKALSPHISEILKEKKCQGLKSCGFLIGPEGGFSDNEVVKSGSILKPTLGKRILRTETAGMYLLSLILYELES